MAADAGLDRGAVRHPLGHQGGDGAVVLAGPGGATSTSGRSTSVHPTTWLACTWLRPNVRGIGCWPRGRRAPPDERGHVVAVGAEREVAVAVHRRGGGHHQRAAGRLPQEPGHLAEVVGHQLAAPLVEGGPATGDRKYDTWAQVLAHPRRAGRAGRAGRASGGPARRGTARRRRPPGRRPRSPARRWPAAR